MCYSGLLKRFVPFLVTFAAGLFIASFFVSIALPEASWRVRRGGNRWQEMQRVQAENENLRQQVMQLRMENAELKRNVQDWSPDGLVPPPLELGPEHDPPPPPAPKRPKHPRNDILQ